MKVQHVSRRIRRFIRATKAVSALEYAILVGIITIAVGAAIATFSKDISDAVAAIGTGLDETVKTVDDGKEIKPIPTP